MKVTKIKVKPTKAFEKHHQEIQESVAESHERHSLQLGQALKKIGLFRIIQKAHKLYTKEL